MRTRVPLVRATVAALILIAIASSLARSLYPGSLVSRISPVRTSVLRALESSDPLASDRARTVARFDARFAQHLGATYLHIIPGSLFLLVAPFQFSTRVRNRYRKLHRWTGRTLVGVGLVAAVSGLFFGVIVPVAGAAERLVVGIAGTTFLCALTMAVVFIRRGDVQRHRAWMIRAFSLMLGISTVRVVAAVLDLLLTPLAYSAETIFVISLWTGWAGTLIAAEVWLRSNHMAAPDAIMSQLPG